MIATVFVPEMDQKTNFRDRNFIDFETFISGIDFDDDKEDVLITGWLYQSNTPENNKINRSQ